MTCDMPDWVMPAFLAVAVGSIILTIDVMQKTEHDEINRVAPSWLQWLRRLGFVAMSSALGMAMYFAYIEQIDKFVVSLFWVFSSGTYSLLINDIALRLRAAPPTDGTEDFDRYAQDFIASTLARLDRGQKGLDRGQLLILQFLQDIRNNQKMEPDAAIIYPPAEVIFPAKWRPK
jgi:hypothetical protein